MAWQTRAACRASPQLFDSHTDAPETADERQARHDAARTICAACPVRGECADDIDDTAEGIRAGFLFERFHA